MHAAGCALAGNTGRGSLEGEKLPQSRKQTMGLHKGNSQKQLVLSQRNTVESMKRLVVSARVRGREACTISLCLKMGLTN